MDDFEKLLESERMSLEQYIKYRICSKPDADDVIQEVFLTAFQKFPQLKNKESFKPWLISIARNKCNDYYRAKATKLETSIDELTERVFINSRYGVSTFSVVRETLDLLEDKDKQILHLYFWKKFSQAEIAKKLHIPLGTVKSRLHTAKNSFKNKYPYSPIPKGGNEMKKLPMIMPEYTIKESAEKPFSVKWEELMGWFLIPKLGEKLSWGMYDIPSRKCDSVYDMRVIGKAKVHGIEGVELTAKETHFSDNSASIERTFIAQLTDTHCRYQAAVETDGDVRKYVTFLDGDQFMKNWGFGEDNCGNETNLTVKGDIRRDGSSVITADKKFLLDIVGRYTVTICGKSYDTVCVMDVETYNGGVLAEQFLDRNGRTILWRRFNRDDWAIDRYHKMWSEMLPENERLTVNGRTYVHWYDCITDYIL